MKCRDYQKCVKHIVIEPNQWTDKGGNPYQVSIYFEPRVYRYCPRYSELRAVIIRLIALYGKEQVCNELGMDIKLRRCSKN